MDHYSLETLGKQHQRELVREALREQEVQRSRPRKRLTNRFKPMLIVSLSLIVLLYFWLLV
jgi:uncharacterized membrane protein (DUF106 family)